MQIRDRLCSLTINDRFLSRVIWKGEPSRIPFAIRTNRLRLVVWPRIKRHLNKPTSNHKDSVSYLMILSASETFGGTHPTSDHVTCFGEWLLYKTMSAHQVQGWWHDHSSSLLDLKLLHFSRPGKPVQTILQRILLR